MLNSERLSNSSSISVITFPEMAENVNPNPNPNPPEAVAVAVTEEKCAPKEAPAPALAPVPAPAPAPAPETGTKGFRVDPIKLLIGVFTGLSFLFSIPILFSVVWLIYTGSSDCEHLLRLPRLQIYIVIGLGTVFVVSNVFLAVRARFPVPSFLLVILLLIIMLAVGLGLTGSYSSRNVRGSPMWLKSEISKANVWSDIKSCIYETGTCQDLTNTYMFRGHDFNKTKLSYIESGCCRPPRSCGMVYVKATFWTNDPAMVTNISTPHDNDCDLWSNDDSALCYDCYTCKEGFQKTVSKKWWKIGKFMVVIAILLGVFNLLLFLVTMVAKSKEGRD